MDNKRWGWAQRLKYNKHIYGNNVTMVLGQISAAWDLFVYHKETREHCDEEK